ncbi:MAG: c-type cytochrome [Mariprofundaceae bacterium]|nr:c-type cytochrome [Mariprofundaceae bacterium]
MSDHTPNDGTTGHEWDGIRELTNKPPKWWALGFYAGLTFVTCYYIIYPSTPMNNKVQEVVNGVTGMEVFVHGHTKGIMGIISDNPYYQGEEWTQAEIDVLVAKGHNELTIKAGDLKYQDGWTAINEMRDNVADIEAVRATSMAKLDSMSVDEIIADDDMLAFAMGRSRVLFGDSCAACHSSGGQGNLNETHPGNSFPNLTDDDWLFGGWSEKIVETITDGREASMPAKGGNDDLTAANVSELADFVVALSTGDAELDNDGMLTKGESFLPANALFQETCSACHGANAQGSMANYDFDGGAVNLTDGIWRFGGSLATITETITQGRTGKMPSFAGKLDATSIKILAVRVHQLGGGMAEEPMEPEEIEEDMMDETTAETSMDEAV